MQDYETLIAEHDHLTMLAGSLTAIVRGATDPAGVLAVRGSLSMALSDHLSKEDSFFYEELLSSRDRDFPAAVEDFQRSFADLAADWADYLRTWDAECIAADWPSFRDETIAIMKRLQSRIAEENGLLYPLALHKGRIRLRAAA
ncbi:MAG: hemerythrin domain-containing protein [Sphingomonas sp.]|nr:hemerythrin domain-containing protein [Sphingomonas sp.]